METTTTIDRWHSKVEYWGDEAYEETKSAFFHLVVESIEPRAQAFAIWALSHDPTLEGPALHGFGCGCGNDIPTEDHLKKAREVLDIAAPRKPAKPRKRKAANKKSKKTLSNLEKALLADLGEVTELVERYKEALTELETAQQHVDLAKAALAGIDPIKAQLVAQHDSEIARLLEEI